MRKEFYRFNYNLLAVLILSFSIFSCDEDDAEVPVATPSSDLVVEFTASANFLDITTTNTSRNAVSYQWDFGDGVGSSTDFEPTYSFSDSGTYTIELTATSEDGSTDTYAIALPVDRFIVTPSASFTSSVDLLTVSFINNSNDAVSYHWDFGDGVGTSTEENPTYTYASSGTYTVTLTATSTTGDSRSITADVMPVDPVPPVASFTAESAGTVATFTDTTVENDGQNLSYHWDFGDGMGTSTDQNPTYAYSVPGEYLVTLTVTFDDIGGQTTSSASETITISNLVAPVAGFSLTNVGTQTTFINTTDVNDGMNVTYFWDFGDGTTSSDENPLHNFSNLGLQTIELVVSFDDILGETQSIIEKSVFLVDASTNLVLNGDFDYFTSNTGDNADAWDMTPNSTLVNNSGETVPSPFRPIWRNTDLNDYIDVTFCTSEQPGSTSDGTYQNGVKTRGGKLSNSCRRLYQTVSVQAGATYNFSIDTRSEAMGVNTEVFILNNEITTEDGIMASADAFVEITNDFNDSSGSPTDNTFTNTSFTFVPTTNEIVIYVRALAAVDSSNEVFIDNVIITAQ